MTSTLLGLVLLAASTLVHAGFDEFAIIDFRSCRTYPLTSEWSDAEFGSVEAKLLFEREREIAGLLPSSVVYALYEGYTPDKPPSFAGCEYKKASITCKRIGNFPYATLSCPFGGSKSKPWVRTCQVSPTESGVVRMYWVDTGEHEDGSGSVNNPYLDADSKRLSAKCKVPR